MFNFPTVKIRCGKDTTGKNGKAIFVAGRMYHVNMNNKSAHDIEVFSENKKWEKLYSIVRSYSNLLFSEKSIYGTFKKDYKTFKKDDMVGATYLTEDKKNYFVYNRNVDKFLLVPKSYIQI